MSSVNSKYKTTIAKLLDLELSIKEKYDTLFMLDYNNSKNNQAYKSIIQEIKGLKHFENELLKELPNNYPELAEIIKELKSTYLPLESNDLNLKVPRAFPYSNYSATRLINKLIYYIISNFEKIVIYPIIQKSEVVDAEKLADANNSAFVTSYNNYLRQDIVNIQAIINSFNTNPFIRPKLGRNFYDLCYTLPYLEDKYLYQEFKIFSEYTITSDVIPSFYGINQDVFRKLQDSILTKICLEELYFMSTQDIYALELDNNLFAAYFSQSLVQASLLIANPETLEKISCMAYSLLDDDSSYEQANQMIKDIFTNVENNNISLSRVQFRV